MKNPLLVRAWCSTQKTPRGTAHIYWGKFDDGTRRKLRTSMNPYVSVAQLEQGPRVHTPEFVFGSQPNPRLRKFQQDVLRVVVQIETPESGSYQETIERDNRLMRKLAT